MLWHWHLTLSSRLEHNVRLRRVRRLQRKKTSYLEHHKIFTKMGSLMRLLTLCLLIGLLFYADDSFATPIEEDYQGDEYDYGDGADEDTSSPAAGVKLPSTPPYFENPNIELDIKLGDDVILNCDARNFQITNAVVWYKNSTIIANGQNAINNRVEGIRNNSLLIRHVVSEDADDYYCVVLPENVRQHTILRVAVQKPISILCDDRDLTDRSQTFKEGENHVLKCVTHLTTAAEIKWSLNGQRLSGNDDENGIIKLDNVDEENIGVYQCLGDDGSREPSHAMVTIDVQYSPKVSTHKHHYVNAQTGTTAELYCEYRANPIAISLWLKNGNGITLSNKHTIKNSMHKSHNRTVLTIKDVEDSDLGEYLCLVENSMGSSEVKVHLGYHPEPPQYKSMSIDGNKVTLHWLVRSLQPLSEAVLDYKMSGSYTWSTVSVIHTQRHDDSTSGIWKLEHKMELTPGDYSTRVKVKNTKGWSSFSANHDFIVPNLDDSSEIADAELPPDDLVRAGFGLGGNTGGNGTANTLVILPSLLTFTSLMLLKL